MYNISLFGCFGQALSQTASFALANHRKYKMKKLLKSFKYVKMCLLGSSFTLTINVIVRCVIACVFLDKLYAYCVYIRSKSESCWNVFTQHLWYEYKEGWLYLGRWCSSFIFAQIFYRTVLAQWRSHEHELFISHYQGPRNLLTVLKWCVISVLWNVNVNNDCRCLWCKKYSATKTGWLNFSKQIIFDDGQPD